jgi:hypothetical protein
MQEVFSAIDHDVYTELLDATGAQLTTAYADQSTEDWRGPRCANLPHAGQFCIVASIGNYPGNLAEVIGARTTTASALAFGPKFLIATGGDNPLIAPDIGGDSRASLDARYCVVFTQDWGTGRNTVWRTIDRSGNLGPFQYHNSISLNSRAVISNSTNGQHWVMADTVGTPGAVRTYGWTVDTNGDELAPPTPISISSPTDITQLSAATPLDDGKSIIGWRVTSGVDEDIALVYVGPTMNIIRLRDLTDMEGGGLGAEYQRELALDSDGEKFVAIYAESVNGSTTNFDVKITSLWTTNLDFGGHESHVAVSPSLSPDRRPGIVSAYSNATQSNFFAFVWDREPAFTTRDVYAGSYISIPGGPITPYCFGDTSGTACPCGNVGAPGRGCPSSVNSSGALLVASGLSDVSSDTLSIAASSMPSNSSCLFFQGTASTAGGGGSVFGDGLRCASGTIIRLATKAVTGGTASYPGAGDSRISIRGLVPTSGGQRFYQAWYRNAASFCTASTFNTTNGISVVWQP